VRVAQRVLRSLCRALRPHALDLVKAFDIPEDLLDAPIAGDWDAANAAGKVPGYVSQA
jgi:hypothetical protein